MLNSERIFKIKVRRLNSFRDFAYVSNHLHLNSFAWRQDCLIFSKLQTSRISPRPF